MGLFGKATGGGVMDVIRCDEPNYLIWKWHPEGTSVGANTKENSIRWGSSLRVKDGSVAVFVYNQPNGILQDYIKGPFDAILETDNLPILSSIIGLAYGGNTPFQAEVYFINLAQIIQTRFAVPFFDVFDPRFMDYGVPVAVRGSITFQISDYEKFIKLHRLDNFSTMDFQNQIKDAVARYVKGTVSNIPEEAGIPLVQIERKINEINDIIENRIKTRLYDDFGVTVSGVDINAIEIDKSSQGYQALKSVTQDVTTQTIQAQTEVNIKDMKDKQKLGIFEKAGRTFMDIKESAYARHKQTQSANYNAYQTEAMSKVGVAGAEGLGKMGANGGGGLGNGFNPASMMAGLAVGSTIGQNIAGVVGKAMNGVTQTINQVSQPQNTISQTPPTTPPPIPQVMYYVAVNGQATGPFDINTLSQMLSSGQFSKDFLVWKEGMAEWQKAGDVNDLSSLFGLPAGMPPIPNQ